MTLRPAAAIPRRAIQIGRGRTGLHQEAVAQGWLFFFVTHGRMPAVATSAPSLVLPGMTHAISILTCARAAADDPRGWEL
jgi:hypothetical protein